MIRSVEELSGVSRLQNHLPLNNLGRGLRCLARQVGFAAASLMLVLLPAVPAHAACLSANLWFRLGPQNAGGLLYSYVSRSEIPQSTYFEAGLETYKPNPTVLDWNGSASIWLGRGLNYTIIVMDPHGNLELFRADDVRGCAPKKRRSK